jgi:NAD(P)-dependent dehydrogenase (short-subunit alcohol dehydrogenase family)
MVKPEDMKDFIASETPLQDLGAAKSFPAGMMGGPAAYGRSKLVLEYAVRHLAASPALKGADGRPKVIVNTVCPGMCKSDLGRQMKTNVLLKLVSWVFTTIFARSTESGANSYTKALTLGPESHGEMWKNDRIYEPGPMCATTEGRKMGDKIWREVCSVMVKADSSTKALLG